MLTIRAATLADAALIGRLISELADFENKADQVRTTPADIARDGFGANPRFRALIAEWRGQPAGFALFFSYYSTWRALDCISRISLSVLIFAGAESVRRFLPALPLKRNRKTASSCGGPSLNWNQSAIDLYKALGADFLDDWRSVLLAGDGLRKLMEKDSAEKVRQKEMLDSNPQLFSRIPALSGGYHIEIARTHDVSALRPASAFSSFGRQFHSCDFTAFIHDAIGDHQGHPWRLR
jgi:hypothetical protein